MVWAEYSRSGKETEWEEYWRIRCRWLEGQLQTVVDLLTDEQRRCFNVGRFEWERRKDE